MHIESSQKISTSELATPPSSGIFYPIQISPSMIPPYPLQNESSSPMYPNFPPTYEPVLTGKCPVNFSAIAAILTKTASDCSSVLAPLVANVICCPQFSSLVHIFQGFYSSSSDKLVVQTAVASDCFSDIVSILASRGANNTIPALCSIKSSNLTGGSCPVNDVATFENTVNTSKLLDACGTIDPLKECCRPVCQPAIAEAALRISGGQMSIDENKDVVPQSNSHIDVLNDCKGVVYSYISRKLSSDAADTAFRILSSCKVNKGIILSSFMLHFLFSSTFGSLQSWVWAYILKYSYFSKAFVSADYCVWYGKTCINCLFFIHFAITDWVMKKLNVQVAMNISVDRWLQFMCLMGCHASWDIHKLSYYELQLLFYSSKAIYMCIYIFWVLSCFLLPEC